MMHALWSLKGGVGTTTTAIAIALQWARNKGREVLLVDTQGDIPHAIGLAEPNKEGLSEWLTQSRDLSHYEQLVTSNLSLLSLGHHPITAKPEKLAKLVECLTEDSRQIIVDCGCLWRHEFSNPSTQLGVADQPGNSGRNQELMATVLNLHCCEQSANFNSQFLLASSLLEAAEGSILVSRSCFLGLRRIARSPWQPSGIILLRESGRALTVSDVSDLARCPVIAQLEPDIRVGRAIDAGLLASALPEGFLADLPESLLADSPL